MSEYHPGDPVLAMDICLDMFGMYTLIDVVVSVTLRQWKLNKCFHILSGRVYVRSLTLECVTISNVSFCSNRIQL